MINIEKLDHLFKEQIDDMDICFFSFDNNDEDIAKFSTEELGKINLLKAISKELPYKMESQELNLIRNQIKGNLLIEQEFLGSKYNASSNCLYLEGKQKGYQSNYFSSPYFEKSEYIESIDTVNQSHYSCTFLDWYTVNGSLRMTNKEINSVFLETKYHLLDQENPIIHKWEEKWLHHFDDYKNVDACSWTLFYPKSKITIVLLIIPYL
ncbi:hypothetical protein [Nonlabens xylanidelens]|uniref:hypothetical protein n=1 Tax=Nonlabens xylanidelens TaxID=191564 RepID=UPI000CECD4BF|nr:hypothetical protein [Nonlabens xylanidelens]PQJ22269.1 hypothetical protein BST94_01445 [Nonlabens xylanidelens]